MSSSLLEEFSILLVDDDDSIRNVLGRLLQMWSPRVYVAENGEEGLKQFITHQPDIIISDIRMPVMNGLEMIRKIRQENMNVPIVIATAFEESSYLHDAMELHVERYLLKPIIKKVLKRSLEQIAQSLYYENQCIVLHSIVDLDNDAVIACSENRIIIANGASKKYFGETEEDMKALCRGYLDDAHITHGNEQIFKVLYYHLEESVNKGSPEQKVAFSTSNGEKLYVSLSKIALYNDIYVFRFSEKRQ